MASEKCSVKRCHRVRRVTLTWFACGASIAQPPAAIVRLCNLHVDTTLLPEIRLALGGGYRVLVERMD